MRAFRTLVAGFALLAGSALVVPAPAEETITLPTQTWSFDSLFGTYDLAAAQRGFQIYSEVCSNCHSMNQLFYRNLAGIGLSAEQIKSIAAGFEVPLGLNDAGEPVSGPASPSSRFRAPFANEKVARAVNNGALPPDLSLIVNAREGGADYVYDLLTGFAEPPAGMKMQSGMNYNKYFPGHQIAMRQPLQIQRILLIDRLVEIIGGFDVAFDFRRQAAIGIEGAARRGMHHEKGQGDDNEHGGQGAKKAPEGIACHGGTGSCCPSIQSMTGGPVNARNRPASCARQHPRVRH